MGVLRLKLPTDPRWVNIVEKMRKSLRIMLGANKKQTNAITIITNNQNIRFG
jgi:tRNA-(ms[2]io[6]A)-hydroxylase